MQLFLEKNLEKYIKVFTPRKPPKLDMNRVSGGCNEYVEKC